MKLVDRMSRPSHQAVATKTRSIKNLDELFAYLDGDDDQSVAIAALKTDEYRAALIKAARLDPSLDAALIKTAEAIAACAEPGQADITLRVNYGMIMAIKRLRYAGYLSAHKGVGDGRYRATLATKWTDAAK
ncbi:hypothetical protein AS156_30890 [Bradyrhizobium macuxiense]|uniref:Uncharacterized protein n=1 Tax=Bradyrhizobium macuxiense TaxID=1755647 RepID=A0A109K3A0_9BRAD|nr:hypothetical protein [Bradyrhizobium macuxiense]KWV59654.1 hypothetical protein AS156_30890 [Bradyrhizobium macuxiense]